MTESSSGLAEERVAARSTTLMSLGLALGPAVALGLARFAYALLLPAMRSDLGWSYAVAGAMNTANAVGYLLGAIFATPAMQRIGLGRTFRWSMLLTACALLFSSVPTATGWLLALRAIAGLGGALTFIAGGALAAQLATRSPQHSGTLLAVYFGGGGLGILTSGLVVPLLIQSSSTWRWGWISLGVAALVATLLSWLITRSLSASQQQSSSSQRWSLAPFMPIFAAYLLFACGYIAYMTFVIALLRGQAMGTAEVALFWSALGIAAMLAPRIWGAALSRAKGGRTLAVVLAVVCVGAALPLASTHFPVMLLSGIIFGGSFLVVPTAITTFVRHALPHAAWPSGIAVFTVVFAIGQIIGPLVSGLLADLVGGLQVSLGFSAGLLLLGAICAFMQRDPRA